MLIALFSVGSTRWGRSRRPPHLVLERVGGVDRAVGARRDGKIQVGVAPGGSATVIVPAWGVPTGRAPSRRPAVMVGELRVPCLFELLLQAARAVAPTTAHTAIFITGWATFIRSPCSQGGHGEHGRWATACQERGQHREQAMSPSCGPRRLSCSARSRPAALPKRKLSEVANPGQHRHKLLSMPGDVRRNWRSVP